MQNLRDQHTSTSPTKHQQTNANGNQSTDAPPWMGGDGGNAERGEIGIADADAERDNHQQTTLTQQELGGTRDGWQHAWVGDASLPDCSWHRHNATAVRGSLAPSERPGEAHSK